MYGIAVLSLALAMPLQLAEPTTTTEDIELAARQERISAKLLAAGIPERAAMDATIQVGMAGSNLLYIVRGSDGRRNREVTGPVTVSVQGVPAQPVDTAVFDGVGQGRCLDGRRSRE